MVAAPAFLNVRLRFTLTNGQPLILLHAGVVAIVGRESRVIGEGKGRLLDGMPPAATITVQSTITVLHDRFLRDYDVTETPDQVVLAIDDMFAKLAKVQETAYAGHIPPNLRVLDDLS
jgi:hypothetical protein